uniref:Uncharacterized protein n=1 Tax=Lepeophtheirus salmonis TaxID=72036 RepID=A0A0K2TCT1_LEPSM
MSNGATTIKIGPKIKNPSHHAPIQRSSFSSKPSISLDFSGYSLTFKNSDAKTDPKNGPPIFAAKTNDKAKGDFVFAELSSI